MNRKAIMIISLISFVLIGCNKYDAKETVIETATEKVVEVSETTETESETYRIAYGRYYTNGTVKTIDGHEWGYSTTEISGREPYDGIPVVAIFVEAKEIENDIIKGLVYDMETAIYDALESEMETNIDWEITRNENEIRIDVKGE